MIAGTALRGFDTAMKYFGRKAKRRVYTQQYNENGDLTETLSSEEEIDAIFDMDNDSIRDRNYGEHTENQNLIFIKGSQAMNTHDYIYNQDTEKIYEVNEIRSGVAEGRTVYKGLVVNEVI